MRAGMILICLFLGALGCNETQNRFVPGRPTFYKPSHRSSVASVITAQPVAVPKKVIGDSELTPEEQKAVDQDF